MKNTQPYNQFVAKTLISGLLVEKYKQYFIIYCLTYPQKNLF